MPCRNEGTQVFIYPRIERILIPQILSTAPKSLAHSFRQHGAIAFLAIAVGAIAGETLTWLGEALYQWELNAVGKWLATAASALPFSTSAPVHRILCVIHVLGVTIGLGTALFMDCWMVRYLYHKPFTNDNQQLMQFATRAISMGLALLWLSGFGFVWQGASAFAQSPDNMHAILNSKMWAKMTVVALLTLNGLALHRILPRIFTSQSDRPLFQNVPSWDKLKLLGIASISFSGWSFAFVLGMVRELNFAFSYATFLAIYAAYATAALFIALAADRYMQRQIGYIKTASQAPSRAGRPVRQTL